MLPGNRRRSLKRVGEALRSSGTTGFLGKHVPEFYASVTRRNEDEARQLVMDSFGILYEIKDAYRDLPEAAKRIYKEVFRENDPDFWFTKLHRDYNQKTKPGMVVPVLSGFLKGRKVLDIGAGSGYLARQLHASGYSAEITDVIDYRNDGTGHLPFRQMTAATELPYGESEFDSAIFFEVLHHVDQQDIVPVLKSAGRVSSRIVVVENTFGDMEKPPVTIDSEHEDSVPTGDYLAMESADQLKTLVLMDYYVNVASKGITEMNMPFSFKTVGGWLDTFREAGMSVADMRRIGFFRNTLNRNFQTYFVLNSSRQGSE